MSEGTRRAVTIAAAVGSGAAGGLFLAFSTFVMTGLRRLPPAQGLHAMNAINRSATTSAALMATLFGTGVAGLVVAIGALRDVGDRTAVLQLLAVGAYLVGVVGLTVGYHVPRNEALLLVDPAAPGAASAWRSYAAAWTAANHVRTFSALGACALLAASLRAG
jgi:uncharacterized membrane protein